MLVAQASGFGAAFRVLSIGLAPAVLILGTLTGIRVHNASLDDAALLGRDESAERRLPRDRPTIGSYLVASWKDDQAGILRTYTMGNP